MSGASLKAAVDGLLGAWDRAPVKKPLVVGFAVSATSQREMTAAEARSLCGARGHHVIADIDELIPSLRRIVALMDQLNSFAAPDIACRRRRSRSSITA